MISISEHTIYEEDLKDVVIVDFGACEGTFLKGCLKGLDVKRYIAVEANPYLYNDLKQYQSDKVEIIHGAAVSNGDNNKVMTFYVDPVSKFNSSLLWNEKNWEPHEVKTISLHEVIKRFGLRKIDILKIDIEGAEWDMLEELDSKLFNMIDQITVEFHDFVKPEYRQRTKKIVNRLRSLGYRHRYKGIKYMHNSDYYDSLFYKSDKKEGIFERLWEKIKPVKYY
jgi:FkbM family methyltransferase